MRKIFALRRKGSDEMKYILAETEYRAKFTAGKPDEWEILGHHSVQSYSRSEELFNGIYEKTAKKLMKEGK